MAALVLTALIIPATPALAMAPQTTQGWNPATPPQDIAAFDTAFATMLYAITCDGVSAAGWSADVGDDPASAALLVTTSSVAAACQQAPESLVVRQGAETFPAIPGNSAPASGLGSVRVVPDRPFIDWDFVPSPRVGEWVGIGARKADGSPLPMLERRIFGVGEDTFTLHQAIGPEYVGAPVVDNQMRVLGTLTRAGVEVTGSPFYCDTLVVCTDASKVWWDITAPSAPRSVKATPGRGSVTVSWKPAASNGGAEVAYWFSVNGGPWTRSEKFSVTRKARAGTLVTVTVQTINAAGPGPAVTVSRKAR